MPLAETIRRDSDPDPDREAALGHRDHFARIAGILCSFFVQSSPRRQCENLSRGADTDRGRWLRSASGLYLIA